MFKGSRLYSLETKFPNHWMIPKKKLAYPYEHYKSSKEY